MDYAEFRELYLRYWYRIYNICYCYTKDKTLSEDFVQEIFKSLWEKKDTLIIKTSYENYLLKAARLQVFHHFRKKSLHKKHHGNLSESAAVSENTTEDAVIYKEMESFTANIVEGFSSQVKLVYELSRIRGLKTIAIAEEMDISEKTVKNHLTKALRALRHGLKELDN